MLQSKINLSFNPKCLVKQKEIKPTTNILIKIKAKIDVIKNKTMIEKYQRSK